MKFRNIIIATVGSALILASSLTAGAAQSVYNDDDFATVSVRTDPGVNIITVSITGDDFGTYDYSLSTEKYEAAGTLTVTVDDMRGTAEGWDVALNGTDFAPVVGSSVNADSFSIENLYLHAGEPALADESQLSATTSGQDVFDITATNDPQPIWTAENNSGAGTFTLDLVGDLTIPGGTLFGNYSSLVTVSLASGPGGE
jgi:hypothetical protein